MLIPLILLLSQGRALAPTDAPRAAGDAPVRVWFSSDGDYEYGDRAKVYARPADDGYLVVLHADAAGRVHVLFPIDPQRDQQVRRGKKYELKGRGEREAFVVNDTSGTGTVLAALSKTPFRFDEFGTNGHWDHGALSEQPVKDDPEAGLMDIVRRMQGTEEHFDYDVATYVVSPRYARWRGRYPYPYPWADWWGYRYGPRIGLGLWFGPRYYYRPFHRWGW